MTEIVECLECASPIEVPRAAEEGDMLTCLTCGVTYEITSVDPVEISELLEIDQWIGSEGDVEIDLGDEEDEEDLADEPEDAGDEAEESLL
jgi:hypothetical protein